jgi:LacI family transcriptional regulator
MKRSTISDVARIANVSVSTVSHVANRTRHVESETEKRVLLAIAELNYVPNSIAQALKSARTKTIGMVVASSTNPFFAQVIHGVGEECTRLGFSLILANCGDKRSLLTAHVRTLLAKRIDGLLVMTTNSSQEFFEHLPAINNMPVVAIDTIQNQRLCTVNDDSFYGGSLVGQFLAGKSLRNVVCIAGPIGHPSSDLRLNGFMHGLNGTASPTSSVKVFHGGDLGLHDGFVLLAQILAAGPPPDAVFAVNDLMAIGAISALQQAGLRVPDDVQIVGYDDIEFSAYVNPPLTTVRQQAEQLGKVSAELIINNLGIVLSPEKSITLTPELILRNSSRI